MQNFITKYKRPATRLQRFAMPSLTVPDQTMSLKTMVTKYAKGLPISAPSMNGKFTDNDLAIDFEKLDLAEQEEAIYRVSDELSNVKGKIHKEREETAANQRKEAEKALKRIEELEEQLKNTKH